MINTIGVKSPTVADVIEALQRVKNQTAIVKVLGQVACAPPEYEEVPVDCIVISEGEVFLVGDGEKS